MWKLELGFVIFAAVALFAIYKAGGNVDMSGEKHGADAVHAPEDAPSEADTDAGNPLSRSKLNKMKVEKLKDICADRGCSTEGTKQQLVERILGLVRD